MGRPLPEMGCYVAALKIPHAEDLIMSESRIRNPESRINVYSFQAMPRLTCTLREDFRAVRVLPEADYPALGAERTE